MVRLGRAGALGSRVQSSGSPSAELLFGGRPVQAAGVPPGQLAVEHAGRCVVLRKGPKGVVVQGTWNPDAASAAHVGQREQDACARPDRKRFDAAAAEADTGAAPCDCKRAQAGSARPKGLEVPNRATS